MQRGNRVGFTLIELLVVIAIIAILAAMLFPIFSKAKASAYDTTCANNMKQWVIGLQGYLDDYHGRFPWAGAWAGYPHVRAAPPAGQGLTTSYYAYDVLLPYTGKKADIKFCPYHRHLKPAQKEAIGWSYYYFCPHNNNIYAMAYPDSWLCGFSTSDVSAPSKKPAFCENWANHKTSDMLRFTYTMGYCDGHVKRFTFTTRDFILNCYTSRDGRAQTALKPPHGNE